MEPQTEAHGPPGPLTRHALGQLIEQHRKRQGLSVEQLAGRVGVTSSTLRRYEVGRNMPPFDAMVLIAHQLGLPMRMFDSGDPLEESQVIAQPMPRDPVIADLHTFMADLADQARKHHKLLSDIRRVSVMVSHQVGELATRIDHLEQVASSRGSRRASRGPGSASPTHGAEPSPAPRQSVSSRRAAAGG